MLIVTTKYIRNCLMMAEPPSTVMEDDLEDGEIESDGEETTNVQYNEIEEKSASPLEGTHQQHNPPEIQENYYSKPGKKKKSKSKKSDHQKDKNKKNRKYGGSPQPEDFADSVEKAIRKAMNKNEDNESYFEDESEDRRKFRKRKKNDGKDGANKKRKKQDYSDEMDESEMMCVRGASPVQKLLMDEYQDEEKEDYASDSSQNSRTHRESRQKRSRPNQRERNKNNNKNERRRNNYPNQDPDGVCLYFMQGKCHKGDECIYSHNAQPPRKMELCKFYLMDCCAKRDKCLYMHADFPCKYYHTGLPCIFKDECKFAHGKPLSDGLKNILLKHIESAPKEILGDYPRLNREGAMKMIQNTQAMLIQQFSENVDSHEKSIPSLFEINVSNPQNVPDSFQLNQFNNDRLNKNSPKMRQSRWQNEGGNSSLSPSNGNTDVLNLKNLSGVLTTRQISDLTRMGIENLDQLGQLTVLQLNNIGISLKQITDIQMNTMNIQMLGLINSNNEQTFLSPTTGSKDLDLRIPPVMPSSNVAVSTDLPGQDIDMRFQPISTGDDTTVHRSNSGNLANKDTMIDIDQYTKDALKFAAKDKENIDHSNESFDKPTVSIENKDVDHRVLPFTDDNSAVTNFTDDSFGKKESDTDIRFLQPNPIFKSPEKRHRRSTTDDEGDNLLIDEKWYSSDEEKSAKKKSPSLSPRPASISPAPAPHVIDMPSNVLSRLGDLSKIDISEEVTKLLNTMKNKNSIIMGEHKSENEIKRETNSPLASPVSRDPRSKRSPETNADSFIDIRTIKKTPRVSIYECVDGEPTDGRRRSDVDLRQTKPPEFGDTDLRPSTSGDIDLRLGLPFKAIPNYTPASEIDGSINSHPPIPYKVVTIDIPRPDYTDIRNSTAKSQAIVDPRLRKVFRLSLDESNSDSEKSTKPTPAPSGPRIDPRRKPKEPDSVTQEQKSNQLELQSILQNSDWFKDLSSTQKIFVNQNLAPVTQMVKQYQQEKVPGAKFDLSVVQNNTMLCNIFANLGITLNENGEYTYIPKPKEGLLKTPINYNQFGNMPPVGMDVNKINMMSIGMGNVVGMNNMNVRMRGFKHQMPNPNGGPAPGLLGIAPNMFPPNFGNMGPYNGPRPNNDFAFMDGDQNFPRFPNRGGHRGRGNDRWNRGGPGRGHNRDRQNFNDRGGWKNDRH